MPTLADLLTTNRQALKLSQHAAAARCGLQLGVVRNLEQGATTNPHLSTLAALRRGGLLKLADVRYLLGDFDA